MVPAVGIAQEASTFATERLPFVGVATAPEWFANPWGFGITGASLATRSKTGNPAWGVQLRALLGGAKGTKVAIVTDADPLGAIRAAETTAALRKVGFEVAAPLTLPAPPIDAATIARSLVAGVVPPPPAILLLTSGADALAIAQQLATLGYTGTVGVGESLYAPSTPAIGAGLTALVPIAPIEADTPALRRMTADVRAVDSAAVITPAVAEGYFAADLFLDALAARRPEAHREALRRGGERWWLLLRGARHGRPFHVAGDAHTRHPVRCPRAGRRHALLRGRAVPVRPADPDQGALETAEGAEGHSPSSRRNPTFIVTWYHPTSPPSPIAPRMSVTSNQSRLRRVFAGAPDAVPDRVVDARRRRSDDLRDLVGVLHDGAPFLGGRRDRRIRRTDTPARWSG